MPRPLGTSSSGVRKHVWQMPPRGDVELAKRPSQVGLHSFLGDEQRLCDLPVRAAPCREVHHAPLAGGQRVRPSPVGGAGPDADRGQLSTRSAFQTAGAATGGQLQALIKPGRGEDRWAAIPWLTDLWQARQLAAKQGKPILLWEMDGHPLGCT